METVQLKIIIGILANQIHLVACFVLLYLSRKNKNIFTLAFILMAQSFIDTVAHIAFRTFLKEYHFDWWFLTFMITQSMVILAILIRQRSLKRKLNMEQLIVYIGVGMLAFQFSGFLQTNVYMIYNDFLRLSHSFMIQILALGQLLVIAFSIAESNKGYNLLGNR